MSAKATGGSGAVEIQRVVFSTQADRAVLYARPEKPETVLSCTRRSLAVPPGAEASLGTLFNHLPEAYWLAYTAATEFRFRARMDGAGEVQVWRRGPLGDDEMLEAQPFAAAGDAPVEIAVPAPADRKGGVLYVRIRAGEGGASLREGSWTAAGLEVRPVHLVAGYCTFRREADLIRNVRSVLADAETARVLTRLVVVDQGGSEILPRALAEADGGRGLVRLVRQDNFGGAGGFTRVMLEALEEPGATHVLLMDDDAVTEPESILRTVAFLSATRAVAVGGAMLDMYRPVHLYESGSWVDPATLDLVAHARNVDAAPDEALAAFADLASVDYNAWWFFGFPLDCVRDFGLPLPVFIHMDDVDYGLLLKEKGVRTVPLSSVAIWHEPFFCKRSTWMVYYDVRNKALLSTLHFSGSATPILRLFWYYFSGALLAFNYGDAALTCMAIEDWLAGPSALLRAPQDRHAEIQRVGSGYQPEEIPASAGRRVFESTSSGCSLDILHPPVGLGGLAKMVRTLCRRFFAETPAPEKRPLPMLPPFSANWWSFAAYDDVLVEAVAGATNLDRIVSAFRFRHDRKLFRRLLGRAVAVSLRLGCRGGRAAREWRRKSQEIRDVRTWRTYLGVPDARKDDDG